MFSAKTPADLLQPGCVGLEVDALGPDVPGPGQTRGGPEAEQSAVMLTHHVVLTVRRGEAILDVLLEVRAPAGLSPTDGPGTAHSGPDIVPCEAPEGAARRGRGEPGPVGTVRVRGSSANTPTLSSRPSLSPFTGQQAAVVELTLRVSTARGGRRVGGR